jgi:hypothetical protein
LRITTDRVLGLTLVIGAAVAVLLTARGMGAARARAARAESLRAVIDTTREPGWIDTFASARSQPLSEYDPRWRALFGRILVDGSRGAAFGDPEGGWEADGGDDYAFRTGAADTGDVEMVMDARWDGHGSVGVQGAVQEDAPHRLYEATLWRGRLALIYFIGPTPDRFEILAESRERPVPSGSYRLAFCLHREGTGRRLRAVLRDPDNPQRIHATVEALDRRLRGGLQGIGMLGGGGLRGSHVTGVAVRGDARKQLCGVAATPQL